MPSYFEPINENFENNHVLLNLVFFVEFSITNTKRVKRDKERHNGHRVTQGEKNMSVVPTHTDFTQIVHSVKIFGRYIL